MVEKYKPPREKILETLSEADEPLSTTELQEATKLGGTRLNNAAEELLDERLVFKSIKMSGIKGRPPNQWEITDKGEEELHE